MGNIKYRYVQNTITKVIIVDMNNMKMYKKQRIVFAIMYACFTAVMGLASER